MERYPNPDMNEYAGVLDRRLEALILDGLIVGVPVMALGYVLGVVVADPGFGGVMLFTPVLMGVSALAYQVGMESYYGQTLGKAFRGIVVVGNDGSDMTWEKAVIRNLLRVVDGLPAFYLVGIVSAYMTDDHQRIGDLAGETVVVYTAD